jgi:8-oxo-dGTP pyrophosphatase MutT (NUDIX family)
MPAASAPVVDGFFPSLPEARLQYGTLAYRRGPVLEILLVTSRDTRRWVIPKGWPIKGKKPHASAVREALEEAGVSGKPTKTPFGTYNYLKRMGDGSAQPCIVEVYPLLVMHQRDRWRERDQRELRWFTAADAAAAVAEPDLGQLILAFAGSAVASKS